jgi:acyl-CoA synthetase (AMP-forming)/AMP-acid ligase II
VRILVEGDADAAGVLEAAWEDPQTFAFLPAKTGGQETWTRRMSDAIPDDLRRGHFALFSSGSTGEPKLVFGSRQRAEGLARLLHQVQEGDPVQHTIGLLPLTYSYPFVNQWLWARTADRRYVGTPGFAQPDAVADTLATAHDAMVCLVAAHVPLLESHFGERTFPGVIRVHFAGGRFPQEHLPRVRRYFPEARIYNNYGCIEAMPRLSVRRAEDGDAASDVGQPIPGVELRASPEGEIFFRSPYSAVAFCDGDGFHPIGAGDWVSTGDYGHRAPSGHWNLEGRASEVFKRYGEKISLPMLLGSITASWPGQAAFYRETDSLGELGHVLVLAPPPSNEELRRILATLRHEHTRAHWPLRVESASCLPLLANGKIDGRALGGMAGRRVEWSQRLS